MLASNHTLCRPQPFGHKPICNKINIFQQLSDIPVVSLFNFDSTWFLLAKAYACLLSYTQTRNKGRVGCYIGVQPSGPGVQVLPGFFVGWARGAFPVNGY